jgi:arylsulfatase A-like enzyme
LTGLSPDGSFAVVQPSKAARRHERQRTHGRSVAGATTHIALSLLGLLAASCTQPAAEQRPNILLVVVDTLRADHLGTYGYDRDTTPYIDRLAARGTVFESTIAQSSWTAPSIASLWTSRLPSEVGVAAMEGPDGLRSVRDRFVTGLREDATTLAEVLESAGYTTIAASANSFVTDQFFMLQGFAQSAFVNGNAGALFSKALEMLDARAAKRAPVFLFVHLIDVHEPLRPPAPYDRMFDTLDGRPHEIKHALWAFAKGEKLDTEPFAVYRSHKIALYDGALRYVDDQLRNFTGELARRGLAENTIVVIAADHGEEFWEQVSFECRQNLDPREYCGIGHGHSMAQQLLHVPLIFSGPGIPAGRVARQARNLDVMPTLLSLARVDDLPQHLRGVDLFGTERALVAISEGIAYGYNARAIQDDTHKLVIYDRTKTGETEFLFEKNGPGRTTQVADDAIAGGLAELLQRRSAESRPGRSVEIDENTLRALRALGYAD